jgi:arylsulfatase A-like enzyme
MPDQPNIVVILADDLGYGDMSCTGRGDLKTRYLDNMASRGMMFPDFHSNGAVCSPTRASLLTGRYPHRAGIETALSKNERGLPRNETTIAEVLGNAGYSTAIFGKWHLGDRLENNPVHYGFDDFRGHTYGDSDYISHVDRHGDVDWWHNLGIENEEGYNTRLLTDYALRFITENQKQPFFLYLSHSAIHFPWMTPKDPGHRKPGRDYTSWRPDMPRTLSKLGPHEDVGPVVRVMIEELDDSTGRVIKGLKDRGLEEDTLVVFLSDNGGYLHYGGLHRGEISSNGPLRGEKGDMYEGGHRVPGIAYWPGEIEPGVSHQTALTMDLLPTFLELAGLGEKPGKPLDGTSLLPLLQDGESLPERTLFWGMRRKRGVRRGSWKMVKNDGQACELYNLDEDIGEQLNVAQEHSDIVRGMETALAEWERDVARGRRE